MAGFLERLLGPRRERHHGLSVRLEAIEAAFPRYELAIKGLIDEMVDLLDRTERMRGRAAADKSAAARLRGDDAAEPGTSTPVRVTPEIQAAAVRLKALS